MNGQERRKYPRFDIAAKITIKPNESQDTSIEGVSKDISAEGFCFISNEPFQPGTPMMIEMIEKDFSLDPIYIKGEVVWSRSAENLHQKSSEEKRPYLTGIKVIGIRKADEARFTMLYCERILDELRSYLKT